MFFNKKKNNANKDNSQNDDRIKVDTSTITTMVGVDTVVEGTLRTKSSIRINGTVIGDVRADGVVVLTKTGKIEGTVEAESIIVAGVVQGNMSIRDKVNVEATGAIYGEVITKKFVIDEESIFQGNCVMNRDGKVIPVPPYIKESDKAKEEDKEETKKDSEKTSDKADKKEDSDEKKEDKKDIKSEKEDSKEDEKPDKESDNEVAEDKEDDNEEPESEEKEEKSDSDDVKEDAESEDKATDDTIIIADINEVEGADDIPASDGNHAESHNKKKNKNYIKKSKSLSVEIEE
ncbi:MAG: polymer-forming cytoskeletal protein [Lachnospiraceae bacterium]|nr:polymer-forming cytoskeletal protein [Lachnospiraceae bacterium]